MSPDQLTALLNTALSERLAGKIPGEEVMQLERLSGGANNETWRPDVGQHTTHPAATAVFG
jgi:glutamate formiminotransferase